MKIKILSNIFVNVLFTLSSAFCSNMCITNNGTTIHDSTVWFCMDKNTGEFWNVALDWPTFRIPSKYDIKPMFRKYIATTDLNSIPKKLPVWYSIIGNCKHFIIIHKNYRTLFNEVSYKNLQGKCKELLSGNIEELKSKCDILGAQKLSVLTAINASWEDTLSSMKAIFEKDTPLSHNYTLTEALFILHLKPSQSCSKSGIWSSFNKLLGKNDGYKDEDVLFYAECITGALARVLKYDKKIPADFEFDLINTSDLEWRFMKNAKKLMQAYKDNFIKEQNKMKNSNKNIIERSKKKVYNVLQDEERYKLKQD